MTKKPMQIYSDMRDAVFEELFFLAKADKDIILLMGDQGAHSFKKFQEEIPNQLINAGIAEQNMIGVAAGLALAGKKPFVHAITNFLIYRSFEQIKINLGIMKLPVVLMGIGAGYAYGNDGPTHHADQDIALMRAIPGITILNASDNANASVFPGLAAELGKPAYIRFDKGNFPILYGNDHNFHDGLGFLRSGSNTMIIATGNMVHTAIAISDQLKQKNIAAGVIDLYRLKPLNEELLFNLLKKTKQVITLEEHMSYGGIGTIVSDFLCDHGLTLPFKRFGLPDACSFDYGSREYFHSVNRLDTDSVTKSIISFLRGE